ncbi:ABC transporter permease [Halothiobacillus sp.]|uniref:ABC transporter permease n=1 Tax=Halothiobacillus sp. TaxID=1891311 RepID=UPI0026262D22|nr:ABC transporter permease [Halothiobacillus sp.]MDD4966625.1 ABC transporter permease [Halothiobacillus sp.]
MSARQMFNAFAMLVTREILRFSRIWLQTILPPMIMTSLYFVVFGHLIGPRVGKIDGVPYINFLVPGLILMAVITQSYANVVSSFYGAKFARHIEELLVSPMPHWLIILGYLAGGVARGLSVGAAVTLVALFFANLQVHDVLALILVAALTSAVFSLGGMINAIYANSFDHISIVPTFVLTPLTYLGGVFYSIHMLPPFWQQVSLFNPILYIINGFRYAMLGISDVPVYTAYLILLLTIVILFAYTLRLFRKGIGMRG